MANVLISFFATFVLFVGAVVNLTEIINKIFNVTNTTAKWIVSWATSILLACLGLLLQAGIFADMGPIDNWLSWAKAVLTGIGAALAANKVYDMNEIWNILQIIFHPSTKK